MIGTPVLPLASATFLQPLAVRFRQPSCSIHERRTIAACVSELLLPRDFSALAAAALCCGSLRSPSLRSAPAKAPGERTPREFPLISSFFLLALLIS